MFYISTEIVLIKKVTELGNSKGKITCFIKLPTFTVKKNKEDMLMRG